MKLGTPADRIGAAHCDDRDSARPVSKSSFRQDISLPAAEEGRKREFTRQLRLHSIATPLALMGPAHFSISLSTNRCRYSGDRRSGPTRSTPISFVRACTAGTFMALTVASLSFRTIAAGAPFGRKKAYQVGASKSVSPCSCADASCGRLGERLRDKSAIPLTVLLSICGTTPVIVAHM